ncbi:hypothetical protein NDU88_003853 [Pleurodeles waltl]|uniref:Uncharacterized protein n=1 Tax=Pleurodeles waltl TaxID=8319 RepID=A0AAV7V2P8_PLEWA|nr:hypothetical protein NDU88_003853 [Pleurodeles waltl]
MVDFQPAKSPGVRVFDSLPRTYLRRSPQHPEREVGCLVQARRGLTCPFHVWELKQSRASRWEQLGAAACPPSRCCGTSSAHKPAFLQGPRRHVAEPVTLPSCGPACASLVSESAPSGSDPGRVPASSSRHSAHVRPPPAAGGVLIDASGLCFGFLRILIFLFDYFPGEVR